MGVGGGEIMQEAFFLFCIHMETNTYPWNLLFVSVSALFICDGSPWKDRSKLLFSGKVGKDTFNFIKSAPSLLIEINT